MFETIVDQHAPLKIKFIRGTHAPFINKELSKAIMHKSKLHNMHKKLKMKESREAFKKQRNKCASINAKIFVLILQSSLVNAEIVTIRSSGPQSN